MKEITITEFNSKYFVNYASYDNIRSFGSMLDGLNNSGRKVIHTVIEKNINSELKVSQLGSKTAEFTEYLHGNIDNSIVNLASNYGGSNNLSLLYPEGNFGTRFSPEASASRYIYTYKQKYTDYIFRKEDRDILIKQYFEGNQIEPLFFIPTIPMLLVNGSEGTSTGFRQKILPRKLSNVITALKLKLDGKKIKPELLYPCYENTNCVIEPGLSESKWLVKGRIEKVSSTRLLITEIPAKISLKDYLNILDELEENKIIVSYKDLSTSNIFKFEVTLNSKILKETPDEQLLDMLGLINRRDYEIYTCVDDKNKVVVFNNTEEILDEYIRIKYIYMDKRKEYQLSKMKSDLKIMISKAFFIMQVVKNEISVNNKKKDDIIDQLINFDRIVKVDDSYDYLLRMPIYSLTKEKADELKQQIVELKDNVKKLEETQPKDIWLREIEELENIIKKETK